MRYKKLQGGGFLTFTPFISSAPVPGSTSTSAAATSTAAAPKSKLGIVDDEIYKELMKGGLANDVDDVVKNLYTLQNSNANPFLDTNNVSSSIAMISQVNRLRLSNKMWDEAQKNVNSQGASGEVAVGSSGEVYAKDKDNKVIAMSVSDYDKNKNNLKLLTNGELLLERMYNPRLTWSDQVTNVASSAVGMQKIVNHIKSVISALGTETVTDERAVTKEQAQAQLEKIGQSLGSRPTTDEVKAVAALYEIINTPGDFAKVKTVNSSERKHALKAVNYIWSTLGDAAQKKLAVTAKLNGISNPAELILDMINTQTNESAESSITPENYPKASTKKANGTGSETEGDVNDEFKEKPLSAFEVFHNGKTGAQIFPWNDPSTGKTYDLVAAGVSKLFTSDNKMLGMSSLKKVLDSDVSMVLDTNHVYYGNNPVSLNNLTDIIYDGQDAAKVYMPTTADGKPNYGRLKELKQLEDQVMSNPNLTPEQINKKFADNGFSYVKVNGAKEYIETSNFRPFLVFGGLTGSKSTATNNNSAIYALTSSEDDEVSASMKATWEAEKIKNTPISWDLFTTYYKGLVAIPYKPDHSIYASALNKNLISPQYSLEYARIHQGTTGDAINASSNSLH